MREIYLRIKRFVFNLLHLKTKKNSVCLICNNYMPYTRCYVCGEPNLLDIGKSI